LVIDEGMVKFSGYHPDRHYNPSKPTRYGFRIYLVADEERFIVFYNIAVRSKG
jgi:hypothetical protein